MVFRKFGIEQIGPDRHVHTVTALRMEMHDRASADERVQIVPDCRGLIRQPMEPYGVLRIEHGIGGVDRCFDHIGSQRQLGALRHEAFKKRLTVPVLQRIGQS